MSIKKVFDGKPWYDKGERYVPTESIPENVIVKLDYILEQLVDMQDRIKRLEEEVALR